MAKMDFNELMERAKPWAKDNANKLFVWGMGALLLVRVFIYVAETQATSRAAIEPNVAKFPAQITQESPEYIKVSQLIRPLPPFDDSNDYYFLFQNNIFDPKLVKDERQLDEEADKYTADAIVAFRDKNYDEARRLLNSVFEIRPRHRGARDLKNRLDEVSPVVVETPVSTPTASEQGASGASPETTP